jgi:pimeloyl-ACP methyl ester carboxylesterase
METRLMDRREILKAVGAAAAGAGLPVSARGSDAGEGPGIAGPKHRARPAPPFVETGDGTRLFYRDWGAGRPALFVAPWALGSDWWEYQMTHLAGQGVRCVGYDRRGHGRSGEPAAGYEFDTLADDLAAVLERLDLRDLVLIGHSMGSGEVVRYLSRHGSARVARVVLVAPITPFTLKTADNPDGVDRGVLEAGRAALARDRPGAIAGAAAAFFGPNNAVSGAMKDWWTAMILHQCSLRVMLELHRVFTETDFRPDLGAIRIPTLVVHGDSDTSTPLEFTGRRTARLIAGSELKVYEGAAHGLPITHMDRLNADLRAFVRA